MKRDNKTLYNNIIKGIDKEVKRALNEGSVRKTDHEIIEERLGRYTTEGYIHISWPASDWPEDQIAFISTIAGTKYDGQILANLDKISGETLSYGIAIYYDRKIGYYATILYETCFEDDAEFDDWTPGCSRLDSLLDIIEEDTGIKEIWNNDHRIVINKILKEDVDNCYQITEEFKRAFWNTFVEYDISLDELIEKAWEAIDKVNSVLTWTYLPYILLTGYGSNYYDRYEALHPKSVENITDDMINEFENILRRDYPDWKVDAIIHGLLTL